MRVRLTHSFIIILVSFTFLSEVFRLLIAPSGQVDPEARGLREYISNTVWAGAGFENYNLLVEIQNTKSQSGHGLLAKAAYL